MKWMVFLALSTAGCLPATLVRNTLPDPVEAAWRVIDRSIEAHGGMAAWRAAQGFSACYQEAWNPLFAPANPWDAGRVRVNLHWATQNQEIRMESMDGPVWRYAEGALTGPPSRAQLDYALPRTHFLLSLPFKFRDAGVVPTLLGKRVQRGRSHDEVWIRFVDGTGKTSADQFWVLFDEKTGLLSRLFLTVTAYHPLAFGSVRYGGWQAVGGLNMPTWMDADYPDERGAWLHRSVLRGLRTGRANPCGP
jgi:hypothetical protein